MLRDPLVKTYPHVYTAWWRSSSKGDIGKARHLSRDVSTHTVVQCLDEYVLNCPKKSSLVE
jgi:hypothetical protein